MPPTSTATTASKGKAAADTALDIDPLTSNTMPANLDFRDIFYVLPEIVLAVWGLFVLLVDVGTARGESVEARRQRIGVLSLIGVGLALIAAVVVCFVPLFVRGDSTIERWWLSAQNTN